MRDNRNGSRTSRRKAYKRGRKGEWLAAISLRLKGYRIVERGFRTKSGEIDIIARRGDLIAIVEVKARADEMSAINSVTASAQHRIANAADIWFSRQRDAAKLSLRFDIIAIIPGKWPKHFPDAF